MYEKQLEDLKSCGNLEDLPKYLKKVQHLDARIHNALDKIQCFNAEEDAYGWERSQFPLQEQVRHCLHIIIILFTSVLLVTWVDPKFSGLVPPSTQQLW